MLCRLQGGQEKEETTLWWKQQVKEIISAEQNCKRATQAGFYERID